MLCLKTWPTVSRPAFVPVIAWVNIIDIADIADIDAAEVADTYFALMDWLGTDGLPTAVSQPP